MAELFPGSLQDKFNEAGFRQTFGETSITSSTEVGEPKKRNRYTKSIDEFSGTIELERSEYSTFETFYKTTLAGGVRTFNFDHPITQVTSEFQFVNVPTIASIGGNYFRIAFTWREVA